MTTGRRIFDHQLKTRKADGDRHVVQSEMSNMSKTVIQPLRKVFELETARLENDLELQYRYYNEKFSLNQIDLFLRQYEDQHSNSIEISLVSVDY